MEIFAERSYLTDLGVQSLISHFITEKRRRSPDITSSAKIDRKICFPRWKHTQKCDWINLFQYNLIV